MRRDTPVCSVIVPTRERPRQLASCLAALAAQQYPRDRFEVLVVDDGSTTPLQDVVTPFRARLEVTLLRQARAGPAAARNVGAAQARGDLLAFTDDDCTPAPGWLAALAARHMRSQGDAIGGSTACALAGHPFAAASQLLITYLYDYYNLNDSETDGARFLTSNNLALPRERFLVLGGFDISFPSAAAEDRELCDRWRRSGFRLVYAPEAVVNHAHALTLRGFWLQHFGYGRGAHRFHWLRGEQAGAGGPARVRIEPISFYVNLLRYPFTCAPSDRSGCTPFPLGVLLALSQIANASGYFWEKFAQSGALPSAGGGSGQTVGHKRTDRLVTPESGE